MNTAAHYARALFALVEEHPAKGEHYLQNIRAVLVRRGHEKLLPRIFAEYQKLGEQKERAQGRAVHSKEQERTRVLLELYQKLVASSETV